MMYQILMKIFSKINLKIVIKIDENMIFLKKSQLKKKLIEK